MKHNDVSWGVWCLEINIFIIHSSYTILISFILNITWHGSFRPWVLLRFPRSWLSLHGVLERQRCLGRCQWWQQPCQCHRKLQWHQCHRKLQWHQVHRSNPMQCLRERISHELWWWNGGSIEYPNVGSEDFWWCLPGGFGWKPSARASKL